MFLEEDHYGAEDFVTSLRLAEATRNEKNPEVDIICIGTYLKTYNYNRDHKTVLLALTILKLRPRNDKNACFMKVF